MADGTASGATAGAQAVRRALRVLTIVGRAKGGASIAELVEETGFSRPTVYRLVATLQEEGFLRAGRDRHVILLGPMFLELAQASWASFDLRGAAAAELVRLATASGETVRLMLLSDDRLVCIETEGDDIDGRRGVGAVEPLGASAAGLAIAAFADPATLVTGGFADLDLHLTRARFYAVHIGGPDGGRSVAAPVFDEKGKAVAAICVAGRPQRFSEDDVHALAPAVIEAARQTSRAAGGYPFPLSPARAPKDSGGGVVCLHRGADLNGDSPVCDPATGSLFWIDVLGPSFHRLGTDGSVATTPMPDVVGALVRRRDGGLIAGFANSIAALDPATGTVLWRRTVPTIAPGSRINDGGEDAGGRLWLGVIDVGQSEGTGRLIQVADDGTPVAEIGGLSLPNGIAWSADGTTLYVVDSARKQVRAHAYDMATGAVGDGRLVADFAAAEGRPAGLAIDPSGRLWTALWDGWRLVCFDAGGRILDEVVVPVPRPSDVTVDATGAPRLVFTSARARLTAAQLSQAPMSGALFGYPLPA